jgi:hypothetical protein
MRIQPTLSDAEWNLVIELLQLELRELPVEIRHASAQEARHELHHRLEMVQGLLDRLQQPATT